MKKLIYIFLTFFLFTAGCQNENNTLPLLQTVEHLLPLHADSASILLGSITSPNKLDNKNFAHWCMLSGKVTDETASGLLPIYQWKRAQEWFIQRGTAEEKAQIALYLGRAYVEDGEYDKAMQVYADALELAKEHKAYNVAGYICAYMADLYGFRNIISECLKKRKEAGDYFKEAGNYKSYAYALGNLACEWALADSFALAMPLLRKADSITQFIHNRDLSAAIANAFGLVHSFNKNYKEAEKYFLKAISIGGEERYKDSIALLQVYIQDNQLVKAHELIGSITEHDVSYSFNESYYLLYKAEGKYKEALHYKEICSDILDSLTTARNRTKILEIEKKYNNVKICEENELLKIAQQRNVIIISITLSLLLLSIAGYIIYRQKVRARLYQKQAEIDKVKIEHLHLSVELEEKKQALQIAITDREKHTASLKQEIESLSTEYNILQEQKWQAESKINEQQDITEKIKTDLFHLTAELEEKKLALQTVLSERDEKTDRLQQEIEKISSKYHLLQQQRLKSSAIGKRLASLVKKNKIEDKQTISTDKAWCPIILEVDKIYPRFCTLLNDSFYPTLTKQEFQYCYLHIFGFDGKDEAKLLAINPGSVLMKRARINQKCQKQSGQEISLRDFLIKHLLK